MKKYQQNLHIIIKKQLDSKISTCNCGYYTELNKSIKSYDSLISKFSSRTYMTLFFTCFLIKTNVLIYSFRNIFISCIYSIGKIII